MTKKYPFATLLLSTAFALALVAGVALAQEPAYQIGSEKAVPVHLVDGQEFEIPLQALIAYGHKLFIARFTSQDGAGRPLT